jgi:predicted ATP-grasp superfamily ATP-dependent carboligase
LLAAGELVPPDFPFPAIVKRCDGAGSVGLSLLRQRPGLPTTVAWPSRIERFCNGMPVSVSCICGHKGVFPLPPSWQRLSGDGRFRYEGGAIPIPPPQARRAKRLARRAVEALGGAMGYLGIDMVLGERSDGRDDVVIEINPRLTTSYVGLRTLAESNLVQAMIDVEEGRKPELRFSKSRIEFRPDGDTRTI